MHMCMCVCIKSFTVRNWLMWLWRPASPKFVEWASGLKDPEESMLQFVSEDGLLSNQRKQMLQVKPAGRLPKNPPCLPYEKANCVLFGPSTEWMRPTYILEGIYLTQQPLTSMLISSKNTLSNIWQIFGHSMPQPSWHINLNQLTSLTLFT